jgi:Mg-chelatase subunit ChlI/Mg-chelatase subunit ChlD
VSPIFPFSAVVGQDALKLALLLCAIDPALGGVLVRGPRGVAKTTLARGLAELVLGRFVELPLGATEERVTGTLDLDTALRDGRVQFAPGLLAKAHQGVLYVDEINLLPDALVDLLLDASATGKNRVERDGVSHEHEARFVLIGTMNPEEGDLRPQLIDRFGLAVDADGEILPPERAAIVRHRLAFDADPEAFAARFAGEQRALVERCQSARDLARRIALGGAGLARVTEVCHAARVEGVRADLAMLRAARAHAALHGRREIADEDVDAVAELALAHRRTATPPGPSGGRGGGSSGHRAPSPPRRSDADPSRGATGERDSTSPSNQAPSSADREQDADAADGDRGALAPIPVTTGPSPALPWWLVGERGERRRSRRYRGSLRVDDGASRSPRVAPSGSVDWFRTLLHFRPPRLPGGDRTRLTLELRDLRYRARRAAADQLWIVAVDCSSSMLRKGALAAAKGVALAIQKNARRAGARMALITFCGPAAHVELTVDPSQLPVFGEAISRLGAGGGTPLRAAITEALALLNRPGLRSPDVAKRLVLLTDGRTRESFDDLAPARRDLELLLLDCERGPVRLQRARSIAAALGARYAHVDALV